jgi:hypothetical protein
MIKITKEFLDNMDLYEVNQVSQITGMLLCKDILTDAPDNPYRTINALKSELKNKNVEEGQEQRLLELIEKLEGNNEN